MQQRIEELREAIAKGTTQADTLTDEDLAIVRTVTIKALNAAGKTYEAERGLMDKLNTAHKARMGGATAAPAPDPKAQEIAELESRLATLRAT